MTRRVVVGLGANLGSRLSTMRCALDMLEAAHDVRVVATSRVYETEPVGPPQPRYLNAAALVETPRSLRALLDLALEVERALGRERRERWGARAIDLDLLYAGDERVEDERLTVPHPHLTERAFALAPLLDVLPDAPRGLADALDRLGGAPPVRDDLRPADPPWRVDEGGAERSVRATAGEAADAWASALTGLGRALAGAEAPPVETRVGGCVDDDDPRRSLAALTDAIARGFRVRWVVLVPDGDRLGIRLVGAGGDPPPGCPRPSLARLDDSKDRATAHLAVTVPGVGVESAK